MERRSWTFKTCLDNGYERIQAEMLQNIRDTLDDINVKLGHLPTCEQLRQHLNATARKIRAPKRKPGKR